MGATLKSSPLLQLSHDLQMEGPRRTSRASEACEITYEYETRPIFIQNDPRIPFQFNSDGA